MTETLAAFDRADDLNDDGSVTLRIIPSNWRRFNLSPDTYQLVNGDSWSEYVTEALSEDTGRSLSYDDIRWTYDHAAIVRGFAEILTEWISETLMSVGLESLRDVSVVDSWSPAYYNFQSDGFEVELTCDAAELRALTEGFEVDEWVGDFYRSSDGFASYVTGRMHDDDWRAGYDGEFRIEHLIAEHDAGNDHDDWRYALLESEYSVYDENTRVEVIEEEIEEGYTESQLIEWADALTPTQAEVLPGL